MTDTLSLNFRYITGGTLPADAASYVERSADRDLLQSLLSGEYCYVLNSRQMGKSSLSVRTIARLNEDGVRTAFVDLTRIGAQNVSAEQWYAGLLAETGRALGLRSEFLQHWKENTDLAPVQRFFGALQEVALESIDGPLVVFVDEIDAVRSLSFSADEFFAAVRACYNARTHEPAYKRLAFCLVGSATPADLITDSRMSPFNIGRRIEIHDFTPIEAAPLATGLGGNGQELLNRILYWTGGHPYLTQRLCRACVEREAQNQKQVDLICTELFLTHSARESDDNLSFVRNRLLGSETDLASLLDAYSRMRAGKVIRDDETDSVSTVLKLSGVARTEGGQLRPRNRVYEQVFDRTWIDAHMPDAALLRLQRNYRESVIKAVAFLGILLILPILGGALIGLAHNERETIWAINGFIGIMGLMQFVVVCILFRPAGIGYGRIIALNVLNTVLQVAGVTLGLLAVKLGLLWFLAHKVGTLAWWGSVAYFGITGLIQMHLSAVLTRACLPKSWRGTDPLAFVHVILATTTIGAYLSMFGVINASDIANDHLAQKSIEVISYLLLARVATACLYPSFAMAIVAYSNDTVRIKKRLSWPFFLASNLLALVVLISSTYYMSIYSCLLMIAVLITCAGYLMKRID